VRHAERLRTIGIEEAEQLATASAVDLALRLGVERSVAQGWQDLANLAVATRDEPESVDVASLAVLLKAGVRSPQALWSRLDTLESKRKLYADLVEAASAWPSNPTARPRWTGGASCDLAPKPGMTQRRAREPRTP
jgi:hypothetical protein